MQGDYSKLARITQALKLDMQNADNGCALTPILTGDPDFRDRWHEIARYAMLVAKNARNDGRDCHLARRPPRAKRD